MAYNASQHAAWVARAKNLALAFQNMEEEGDALDLVYTNETSSGSDPLFADFGGYEKQELINVILLIRSFKAFMNNQAVATADRKVWTAPFLVG